MTSLYDILLDKPMPDLWLHGLLFATFVLHLFFVLLMLGTAILGLVYFVRSRWGRDGRYDGWDKRLMSWFLTHKSLAVVLGVGPLLLMQVDHTIPFMTATSLLAPLWLLAFILIIVSLLLLEVLAERKREHRWRYLLAGLIGLAGLLAVPGIFAAVLVTTENPDRWGGIFVTGRLPAGLSFHWLMRVLHVIGAALVFAAAFHYLVLGHAEPQASSTPPKAESDEETPVPDEGESAQVGPMRKSLLAWVAGGIMLQFAVGVALYGSLPDRPQGLIGMIILLGVAVAAWLLWIVYRAQADGRPLRPAGMTMLLVGLLVVMLLARQLLQDRVMVPMDRQFAQAAASYQASIAPFEPVALASYRATRDVAYDNSATIYARSCQFCHGTVGNGQGDDAPLLQVPPEDLTAIRTTPAHLHRILMRGVPGTAMPTFGMYTRTQLDGVIAFLQRDIGLAARPRPTTQPANAAATAQAQQVFASTCAACHGMDGRGTQLSSKFLPAPPDLSAMTFSSQRAFDVISSGYPGTMMRSFASLPEDVRWALVDKVQSLYQPVNP